MAPSPALFPPADNGTHTWPAPNYINPEQRGWGAPAGIIAMCIVTYAVVGARLWARFWVKRRGGVDDWLIICAMVSFTIYLARRGGDGVVGLYVCDDMKDEKR